MDRLTTLYATMREDLETRAVFDSLKTKMGLYSGILETHDRLIRALGAPLGFLLGAVWILRLPVDVLLQMTLIGTCAIATLLACTRNFARSTLTSRDGRDIFTYERRGVSWGFLVSALLGATVVFTAVRFLVESSMTGSSSIATGIVLLAAVITVLIVPVTPILANTPGVAFLKTSLEVVIDAAKEPVVQSRLSVCPADSFVPTQSERAEILLRLNAAFSVLDQGDVLLGNA